MEAQKREPEVERKTRTTVQNQSRQNIGSRMQKEENEEEKKKEKRRTDV